MTSTGTTVRIIECTYTDELHRHYDGQTEAQDAYIELDLRRAPCSPSPTPRSATPSRSPSTTASSAGTASRP
ncbi:hypothetical protein SANTM175S_01240 [Streptomyces antimycoticus]